MQVELLAITPEPEKLIETAARTCYQSQEKAKEGTAEKLLKRLLKMGHESPFEHAYATFRLSGVSRALTHQLVRHRLMAVSQQSQRYVSEKAFEYVVPPSLDQEQEQAFHEDMETIRQMYSKWRNSGLKCEDARFVLPNACASQMVISANFREFRHIFEIRCAPEAQWEIRSCACEMLRQLYEHAPITFQELADRFLST
jgi:thymidylate synthase (FAD)